MIVWPETAVLLAPLAGHTDLPFRLSARRHGCVYAFTEMIDAGSLVFGNHKTCRLAERGKTESFLGIQLVGSDLPLLEKAVEIVNDSHFDVLDFNLGCPAPKVERKCEGIAFALRKPEEALRAVELLVRKSKIPVTVKTRIQDAQDPAPTVDFLKRLENAGVQSVTLHGRVMKAFYAGDVSFDVMRACREALSIPVVANGGVMDLASCRLLREKTHCGPVMAARGALGNPWLFEELSLGEQWVPPSPEDLADEVRLHMEEMIAFYGEELAFRAGRKTLLEYLRGRGYPGSLRAGVSFLNSRAGLETLIGEIRQGPAEGYWSFLEKNPASPRRLSRKTGQ